MIYIYMIVLILEDQNSGKDGFIEPKQLLLHYFDINVKVNMALWIKRIMYSPCLSSQR